MEGVEFGRALMMLGAWGWMVIGGGLVGLIGGIIGRHGVAGTLTDIAICVAASFVLVSAALFGVDKFKLANQAAIAVTFGAPVAGGLIGLVLAAMIRRPKA
jgi:hypothetical protein